MLRGQFLAFFLFSALGVQAWPQQSPLKAQTDTAQADTSLAETDLPDAPQAQNQTASELETQTQTQAQIQTQAPTPASTPPQTSGQPGSGSISTGSVRGVVVDRDGAVYEGVQITLTQPAPATTAIPATSDSNGRFSFMGVPAGLFQLTVAANGFATQKISGLLHPGENYEAPAIVLLVTSATTDVEVTASSFEIAQAELKAEEQQRILGIVPNFYVVYDPNAPPLTAKQKFHLAWRSWIDPVNIGIDGGIAGFEQAEDDFPGYGLGSEGYSKRFGEVFGTDFISVMLGGAILPSVLKQDPRYFYKGTGTIRSRVFYAIANSVICKSDKGRWQPNYSAIAGGFAAGEISNIYVPAADRSGVALSLQDVALGAVGTAVSNLFQEFVIRKLTPHVPNYSASKP